METMKKTLRKISLLLVLVFSLSGAFASDREVLLISDLDDTIKITETNRPIRMMINGFFTRKAFAGMTELYEHMQSLYVDRTVVLTASPGLVRGNIEKLLDKYNLYVDQLITRNLRTESDKFAYKYNNVVEQLTAHPNMKAILVGDDSGEDHEIYHKIKEDFPGRVLAIYIRPVKGKILPEGVTKYISSFDIALSEYNAGRLGYTELRDIADLVATHGKDKEIIPKKSYCPKSGSISTEGVEELVRVVKDRIVEICSDRKVKNN